MKYHPCPLFRPAKHPLSWCAALVSLLLLVCAPAFGGVLQLDGNGDFVTFPAAGIPSGNAPFTVEVWVNPESIPTGGENGGQMTFWGNEAANQANGFRLRGVTGVRHFFWGNDHDETMGVNVLPNTTGPASNGWHHFAITFNGTQTRWYWNGAALGGPRTASGVSVVAANHRIGSRPGGEFFHGQMDELRIWNIARSATEIAADFRRELNGDETGLVAYWNFEGDLGDRAGGNNNGTAVGNATTAAGANAPVAPRGPRIFSFTASTNVLLLGQSATLSWAVSNAMSVVIDNGIGAVTPTNSAVVTPTATTTYTLTTTNTNGTVTAVASIVVDPGIPLAQGISTNTPLETPIALILGGSDPQGSNLTFSVVAPPANGSLSGVPPNVTYSPAPGFSGLDSFTFKVNDGAFDSAPATVSIKVVPPPAAPTGVTLSATSIPAGTGPGVFVALLTAIDVNEFDTHAFQLVSGFGDNAKFSIVGNALRTGPVFGGDVGSVFSLRIRVTDSTARAVEQTVVLAVVEVPRTIVINEIQYNGTNNSIRDSFIELYNDSDSTVDLSQWRVQGGIDFFLPTGTLLAPRAFLVVAENPAVLQARFGVAALGPWTGGLNNEGEDVSLRNQNGDRVDRVDYKSEFPWPVASDGSGPSAQLVNPSLDNDLGSSWRAGVPTPGATNAVFAANAAPNIRQVDHSPNSPASSNAVTITAKVTDPDGVASVTLAYQVVAPGSFLPATLPLTTTQLNGLNNNPALTNSWNLAFEAAINWTTVTMHDTGLNGDAVAGDGIYTAVLPVQANRTLVRYRITVTDGLGASRRAPFEDDPSLNFAYFVYDGVPDYLNFSSASLQTLPVYFLITRDADLTQCTAWSNSGDQLPQDVAGRRNQGRLHFNWEGAFVYNGKVHDHVTFRLRGANGRYHPGKRSFRIRFNDGALFQAYDNNGRAMPTRWREVVTGKGQSNRGGEQFALNEVVNMFLWNKVGVPAPRTLHFHFRVVRGANEAGTNQYSGDFWGLNWAQEKYDRAFLDSHDLPPGNLYKLVDNYVDPTDEIRYYGPDAPRNGSDFLNIENNLTGFQTTDWLNAYANYTNWYRYFTIAKAIRHYDTWPSANKNGAWYFEPLYGASNNFLGRVVQLPYDSTDTWGPTWNNGDDILYNGIFPSTATGGDSGQNPEMQKEYRNTVREIRALLFQPDQLNPIIDAFAGEIMGVALADHARWSNAPAPASYRSLLIPNSPGVTGGLPAYQQDMKNFMFTGGNNGWWIDGNTVGAGGWVTILDAQALDTNVPARPTLTYIGTNGFPQDGLLFQSSAYSDPQGANTFAAMQWRVAEVLQAGTVVTNTRQLKLEWDAAWTSEVLPAFNAVMAIPPQFVEAERLYRVRVRHMDDTGRWSSWSLPVEFRPGGRDIVSVLRTNLVFSEVMYNPPGEGAVDGDEFEFVELRNIGSTPLSLTGLTFTEGINYNFPNNASLAPGATHLIVRNVSAFASRYPGVAVNGVYTGRLNNDGETLTIRHVSGAEIVSLTYGNRAPWPVTANGFGFSLVRDSSGGYVSSAARLGSPGVAGGAADIGRVVINEVLSSSTLPQTDFIELLNLDDAPVDISGWFLTDDPTYPWKFQIPSTAPLAVGAFRSFDESSFNLTPGLGVSFSLSSMGDDVYLFSADSNGQLTGYSHGFTFGGARDGESFGRYVNASQEEEFPAQTQVTRDQANVGPRFGPLVISEVHYHPTTPTDEFIELYNAGASPVTLQDVAFPTNAWRLNGVGFTFPAGVVVPAGGYVVVAADDPAAFRARFNVPAQVAVFRYPGNLQDSGENLELLAPDAPTTNGTPYYVVDAVRYNDRKPWPLAADGAGASLHRVMPAGYGNNWPAWIGAAPTPGASVATGTAPQFTQHPSAVNATASSTVTLTAAATGSAPLRYQWRFSGSNLDGATNATLVIPDIQLGQAGTYQAVAFNAAGSTDSSNALVSVRVGVVIVGHPTNFILRVPPDPQANATNRVTFNVLATSFNPPLSYEWRFNGTAIPGATNASLSFTNVQQSNEGNYDCAVTDSISTVVSRPARFTPWIAPQWVQRPVDLVVPDGSQFTLSAEVFGSPAPFAYSWRRNLGSLLVASNYVESGAAFARQTTTNASLILASGTASSNFGMRVVIFNDANRSPGLTTTFNITVVADTDRDGIGDAVEQSLGLNPNDPADALLDLDGDGVSNRSEIQAGTGANDSASYLRIEENISPGAAVIQFAAVSNRTYTVQFSDVVGAPVWNSLKDFVARSNNVVHQMTDPGWTTNRFYRVVTPQQ